MPQSSGKLGVLSLAIVAGLAVGCAHASKGGYSRFVQGNVPDYDRAYKDLNRPPDESLHHFIARVRRLAATATKPATTLAPSLEATDPVLRDSLATLALGPTSSNHWAVGEAYRHAGVLDRAQDHFQESVRLDPRFAAGWDGLARTWRDWGAPEYALADASRAVYFAPNEPAYRNTLGTVLQALGRWTEARSAYEAARIQAPRAGWALNNLCALDLAVGDANGAAAHCAAAMAADPDLRAARANFARAEAALAAPAPQAHPTPIAAPARAAVGPSGGTLP